MKSKLFEVKEKVSDTLTKWEIEYVGKYTKEIHLPPYFGYIVFLVVLLAIYRITGTLLSDVPAIMGWLLFDYFGIKIGDKDSTTVEIINPLQITYAMIDKTKPEKTNEKINWIADERRHDFIELCRRLNMKK